MSDTSPDLKIAICQMTSVDNYQTNLSQIKNLLQQATREEHLDMAFFPENCLYMRLIEGARIPGLTLADQVFQELGKFAQDFAIDLHLGSVALELDQKLYNSSVFISKSGLATASYQKMHLFDIALQGQTPIRESDIFSHGPAPEVLTSHGWSFGQTICYDLRFSEIFCYYAKKQVDALVVPSAFLVTTGEAHWQVLLRARAIESQAYVIAAAQAGVHLGVAGGSRETYGHSLVIDPWGKILWLAKSAGPEVGRVTISQAALTAVRAQIPMKDHRRL